MLDLKIKERIAFTNIGNDEKLDLKKILENIKELNRETIEVNSSKTKFDFFKETKIKQTTKTLVNLIENLNLNCEEYDFLNKDYQIPLGPIRFIRGSNLKRLIRLRNIVKTKIDKEEEFLKIHDINSFKDKKLKDDFMYHMTLKQERRPNLIKLKFNKTTNKKYLTMNAKYFGVKV